MEDRKRTAETRVLDRFPEVRRAVVDTPAFADWLEGLTSLQVDGETLYVRGGDLLRDKDQLVFEWARKRGLLTDEAVAHVLGER